MKTQKIILIALLTIPILLFCFFWVVAPAQMKDKVVGLITYANADRQCFNHYKNKEDYFKDPDSAYIVSSNFFTKKDNADELSQYPLIFKDEFLDSVVKIKVMARNGLGGYTSDEIICALRDKKYTESAQFVYESRVLIESNKVLIEKVRKQNCADLQELKLRYPEQQHNIDSHLDAYCSEEP